MVNARAFNLFTLVKLSKVHEMNIPKISIFVQISIEDNFPQTFGGICPILIFLSSLCLGIQDFKFSFLIYCSPNLTKINTGTVLDLGSPYPKCRRHGFGARFAISYAVGGLMVPQKGHNLS